MGQRSWDCSWDHISATNLHWERLDWCLVSRHELTDCCKVGNCTSFVALQADTDWPSAGKAHHFSEQQLMDCSWDYGLNQACDGGDYDAALDYLIDAGGSALDQDYEYLGQDGWCLDKNHSDSHNSNLTLFKVSLTLLKTSQS